MAAYTKYTDEQKSRAIQLVNDGASVTQASLETGIPKQSIYTWVSKEHQGAPKNDDRENGTRNLAQFSIQSQKDKLIADFVEGMKALLVKEMVNNLKGA